MKTNILFLLILLCIGAKNYAQNVNIPDANFKTALIYTPSINTNNDSEIQVSEAQAFNGIIYVTGLGINDLTGIETFTQIYGLDCGGNALTSLDISNNHALEILYCPSNMLLNLDVSNNHALVELRCQGNDLTQLDLYNNPDLLTLDCGNFWLTSLDISNNTNLINFHCTNSPSLSCIQVWDTAYADTAWTVANGDIDSNMYFSLDCSNVSTSENLSSSFSLSPNPASDYLYIDSKGEKNISFIISDIWGRTLTGWQAETEVPISHLPAGVYFLTAQVGDKIGVKKFVKE